MTVQSVSKILPGLANLDIRYLSSAMRDPMLNFVQAFLIQISRPFEFHAYYSCPTEKGRTIANLSPFLI